MGTATAMAMAMAMAMVVVGQMTTSAEEFLEGAMAAGDRAVATRHPAARIA